MVAVACGVGPVEAFEDVWDVFGGDSLAGIDHRYFYMVRLDRGGDLNAAAGLVWRSALSSRFARTCSSRWESPMTRGVFHSNYLQVHTFGCIAFGGCRDYFIDHVVNVYQGRLHRVRAVFGLRQGC